MKTHTLSILLFIMTMCLNGCDNINHSTENNNQILFLDGFIKPSTKVVNGRIEAVSSKTIEGRPIYMVLDQDIIDSLGHFTLTIPPLIEEYLVPVKKSFGLTYARNIVFSDTTVQIGWLESFRIYCSDSTRYSAHVWSDSIGGLGDLNKLVSFVYSTKDFSIIGIDSIFLPSHPYDNYVNEYNVIMEKGWNRLITKILPSDPSIRRSSVYVDNGIKGYWLVPNN